MKKLLATLVITSSIFLASCSTNTKTEMSDNIIKYSDSSVTVEDYYKILKTNTENLEQLHNFTILKIYDGQYGKHISKSDVNKRLDFFKKNLGTEFENYLATSGYTSEDEFKEIVKKQLAYEYGVKKQMKVSQSELDEAWSEYHPDMKIKMIEVSDETKAKNIKSALEQGQDFSTLASQNSQSKSTEKNGDVVVNSTSTFLPKSVLTSIYSLKDGEVSDVLSFEDDTTKTKFYFIVKMIKNSDKGTDLSKYKSELTDIIKDKKFNNDSDEVSKIVKNELKKVNFTVNDSELKKAFEQYLEK